MAARSQPSAISVGEDVERRRDLGAALDHRDEAEVAVPPGEPVVAPEHAEHRHAERGQRVAQQQLVAGGCRPG